jgi:APA family basic amino acid/polyamine antiporter
VTFTAGEIKNPRRNVPLSLAFGVGFVLVCYILASAAYMMVLPLHGDSHGATVFARGIQYAAEDRIGAAALQMMFPQVGAYLMAAAILISTFGCANGMTLAGARVYYAMAQDRLFFRSVGKLHPRFKTPAAGLVVQAVWTMFLCVSGSYSQLLDYIIFAAVAFYFLTILGLFVLRFKQPDAQRPYKALGYPFLPAVYLVMAAGICAALLRYKPQYTWPGLILVLLGVPVYVFWSRGARRAAAANGSAG